MVRRVRERLEFMSYSKAFLKKLYFAMQLIRQCEEALVDPISAGAVRCPCHLYSGQEAVAVGMCAALQPKDQLFGSHRSHGHFLAKGGSLRGMLAEIYGKESGCSRGRGGSMHLIDPAVGMLGSAPIVAGTISLALGAALAASIRGDGRVVLSFFGDGAAGEGVLYESMNFAAIKKLPIAFVCENNLYSTHLPIAECHATRDIYRVAQPFGIDSRQVDGNDVLAVYEAGRAAVDACRKGRGPAFLECLTYRLRGHVGPDDNIQGARTDIRPKSEIAKWRRRDPLVLLAGHPAVKKSLSVSELRGLAARAEHDVREAMNHAIAGAEPAKKDLKEYVFR
jgi:TPP-dependent pyruvate/acetoin dehydrogenase alpha subunit